MDYRTKARNYFAVRDVDYGVSSYYAESKNKVIVGHGTACHAQLVREHALSHEPVKWDIIASNLNLETEACRMFWSWITDSKTSPWRSLFEKGIEFELIPDKTGKMRGFIVPESMFSHPWSQVFNFIVASRATFENRDRISIWKELVDKGLSPESALFCVGVVSPSIHGLGLSVVNTNHWPISINPQQHDFEAFEKGQVKLVNTMNSVFAKDGFLNRVDYGSAVLQNILIQKQKQIKGRFTVVPVIEVDKCIETMIDVRKRYA